ncbi:PDZ domain-containing protein [bacterium]|nr:PDZ domain-containing protein [bacterium]MBU1884851.1 PDZ domain-containing protein [bacterium]
MKKISNSFYFNIMTKLLILIVSANIISLVLQWYLPHNGIEIEQKKDYHSNYMRVDFKNMLKAKQTQANGGDTSQTNSIGIEDIILKGLYGNKNRGFVIVSMRSDPTRTNIVGIGEFFNGYMLKSIENDSAIFSKNNQDYAAYLKKIDTTKFLNSVVDKDGKKEIARSDIAYFINNPSDVWKNILIEDVREGIKLKGFKVTKIVQNSIFSKLGLLKGDIIIKVNNKDLHSYNDVLNVYKNIDKLSAVQLVVKRDNQEVELVYEIN